MCVCMCFFKNHSIKILYYLDDFRPHKSYRRAAAPSDQVQAQLMGVVSTTTQVNLIIKLHILGFIYRASTNIVCKNNSFYKTYIKHKLLHVTWLNIPTDANYTGFTDLE